jgi:stage V sporulation protein B
MKQGIFCNLSWVLAGSVVVKLLGGVYRLVLTRVLGTSIGLYQMVFAVYSFLVILISSGIPLAISKLISSQDSQRDRQKVVYGAVAILFSISAVLAFIMVFGSKGIALLQGEGRVSWCYIILAPSLLLSAGSAVLKGYCQGVHKFNISAISGIVEQVVRVVLGLVFMLVLSRFYLLGALFGAMLGTLIGDIASFAFLKISLNKQIDIKYSTKYLNEGKKVFEYAYPIMLYSVIVPLVNFIDSFLVVKLLSISIPKQSSILLYGLQSGVVSAIVSIPSIFSFALASVLMPNLSNDYSTKNSDKFNSKTSLAFKLILFVSLPCAIYFAINASNIIGLLYGNGLNGFGVDGQYVTKNLLIISSIGVVFSGINQLSAVVLQNLNEKTQPIINLSIGMACKFVIELIFVPSKLGIYAYAIAIGIGFVVSGVLNLYAVEKYCPHILDIKYLTKQFILCAIVFGLLTLFKLFNSGVVFVLGSIFTIIIYLIGIYLIKLFSKKEIKQLFK